MFASRRLLTRERLIGIAVALVLGCAGFVYGLRWLESLMTFRPARMTAQESRSPAEGAEVVWFNSADGTRLNGWFFESQSKPATATIIFCHGNGGNISSVGWMGQRFAKHGFNVLLFDYRGYGASDGVAADESGLYADGDAAVAFVVNNKGVRPEQIILYGHSLGTTVVADVASRGNYGAVVLESGLSSASSVAGTALPWLPAWLHFLGRNRFESARKLANVKSPILIAHGDPDGTIPTDEGRRLFASANEPKKLLIVPGAGHVVFGTAGEPYLSQVEQFMRDAMATMIRER
ncbi:MAG TPA: alpha/beta fold hydrolase [Pyrinomonadaceae bacterium]|nr:alpha/beta fold hydrolase [Pyrinomonadaceae bacterium]